MSGEKSKPEQPDAADPMSLEEQLERSEKEIDDLKRALDQSAIVAFTDAAGAITYVNDKFCEISKYSRDELIGKNHRIINSGHHPSSYFAELWKCISSGRIWKGELKNRAKDGSEYWVLTTIVPFLNAKGRPVRYVAIRTDITEFKAAQEQLEQQKAALVHSEKMASLGELAAGIGHELGNPLAALRGRVELMESFVKSGRSTPEQILKTTETLKQLADRIASIIRGMRALSRDGTRDPFQKVSVAQIIHDVLGFTAESFQKHGIEVRADALDEHIQILCQETQIGQVFVNLINNAKDAIADLAERWIRIELADRGADVEVVITDSGHGIPREIREKIMLPFFTTKVAGKGSGLGLSVSATILESHGGNLRIDSSSPHTRFIVRLPKQPPLSSRS